jgi:tetratricopeptide (TPR) repeat protein
MVAAAAAVFRLLVLLPGLLAAGAAGPAPARASGADAPVQFVPLPGGADGTGAPFGRVAATSSVQVPAGTEDTGAPFGRVDDAGPADHLDRGLKHYRDGELDAAARVLRRAVGLDPRLVPAHYHLAKIHLIHRDVYRAFYALREVLALEPASAKARKLLAELHGELLARLQSDIKRRRNLATAYNVMGFLLIQQNRLAEGIRREEFALELDPKLAEAYDDLAWAAYKDGDLERAFRMASRAFELDPVKGSISSHYQQLFNLKQMGVPFPPRADRAGRADETLVASVATDSRAEDSAVPSRAPVHTLGAVTRVRASDLESMAGEDEILVRDYLKTANLQASAASPASAPPPGTRASASPAAPDRTATATGTTTASPTGAAGAATGAGGGAGADAPPDARTRNVAARNAHRVLQDQYDQARKMESARDYRGALALYGKLYAADRGFADVAVRISEVNQCIETLETVDEAARLIRARQFESALATLREVDRRALQRAKGIASVDDMVGEAALGARQFDLAKVSLGRWLDEHASDSRGRYLLLRVLMATSDFHGALAHANLLLEKHPDFVRATPEIRSIRTKLLVKAYFPAVLGLTLLWGGLASGYVLFKYKKGARAREVRRIIERVQLALRKEKWADVIKEVEKGTAQPLSRAEDVFLGCAAGTALLASGDLAKAQKLQRELLEAHPDEPAVHHLTARVMLACKDLSEAAVEEYHRLLSVEPNNRQLLEALNSHYQAHSPESDEAMKVLDRLLELDPTSSEFRYYRALRFLRQKEFSAAARDACQRVLEIDPTRADVRHGLARCHFEARTYLEAIKEIKHVMEADVRSPDLHRMLLTCYARLSMQAEAVREYRQLIARHPDTPELAHYLEQAQSMKEGDFVDEAASREAEALYEKGVRLFQDGRWADAIGPLTAAFGTDHLRLSSGALLVRSYLKTREVRTALGIFERLDVPALKSPDEFVLGLAYDVAEVYLKEGKRERAVELYSFICRSNVSFRDAFQRLEELQQQA